MGQTNTTRYSHRSVDFSKIYNKNQPIKGKHESNCIYI